MKQVFIDMEMIMISYGVFLLAYVSHTIFALYQNIKVFHERFESKRLLYGALKGLVFIIGTLLLVLSIDSALFVFQKIGLADESFTDVVSVFMILSTIGMASLKYIKESYALFSAILTRE